MSRKTITSFEVEYVLPFTDKEIEERKKVIYIFLSYMGLDLKPESINLKMVYATRFIPVRLLMSSFIVSKLMDGWSLPQLTRKYPVTARNVRTLRELVKNTRKRVLNKHKMTS